MIHFSSRSPGRSPLPSMRSMICNSPGPKTPTGKELSGSYTNIEHNLLSLSSKSMRNKCWRKRWRARFKTWFFGFNCTTRQVYEEGAKAVALLVVGGINFHFPITFSAASVFAYGQTSSGKTYTMTGITQYIMADIFEYIQKHKEREFLLKFFAMEIYNKSVRDLLSLDTTPLRLLDDP